MSQTDSSTWLPQIIQQTTTERLARLPKHTCMNELCMKEQELWVTAAAKDIKIIPRQLVTLLHLHGHGLVLQTTMMRRDWTSAVKNKSSSATTMFQHRRQKDPVEWEQGASHRETDSSYHGCYITGSRNIFQPHPHTTRKVEVSRIYGGDQEWDLTGATPTLPLPVDPPIENCSEDHWILQQSRVMVSLLQLQQSARLKKIPLHSFGSICTSCSFINS